eukprot:GHUV01002978.1.p1 GENE.GHUV01002978.1~~GHUV01002978.1.p1  ORF type:complete len:582 (+),score=78.61 GHUV01002978.1:672-2417(+)
MHSEVVRVLHGTARLTLLTTCYTIALQTFWVTVLQTIHRITGYHERTIRDPAHSTPKMLLSNLIGYAGYMLPMCLAQCWLQPKWSYAPPNPVLLGYWSIIAILVGDIYYYLVHRWVHLNKWAFHFFHAKHHEPGAQMNMTSAGHLSFQGALLEGGVTIGSMFLATYFVIGNWWYVVGALHNAMCIILIGHTGQDLLTDTPLLYWSFVAPDPIILWYFTMPIRNDPNDHEDHHTNPRSNFAPFFSFWDDLFGTSCTKRHPCSLLILAAHAVYQAALVATGYLAYLYPVQLLTAYIAVYVAVAPATAAAVGNALKAPEVARYIFGWLMDWYRTDSAISYTPEGQPGSFAYSITSQQNSGVKPDAANTDNDVPDRQQQNSASQQPVYIFGCHPAGVLSRGAFHTFALRGWKSPVSSVQGLRFAIGSQLFYTPILLIREFLIMAGCIPADKTTLLHHLKSGNSVALTPGGFKELQHVRTNNIVLQKRKGFVALALETGAQLVPVLCVGEQNVVIPPRKAGESYRYKGMKWGIWAFLLAHRPYPIKVVFGPAMSPAVGESVEELHARYTAALVQLGQEHGMELQVM